MLAAPVAPRPRFTAARARSEAVRDAVTGCCPFPGVRSFPTWKLRNLGHSHLRVSTIGAKLDPVPYLPSAAKVLPVRTYGQ